MTTRHSITNPPQRSVWFRRGVFSSPYAVGMDNSVSLLELGLAAARESFLTGTISIAAAWSELFESMLSQSGKLEWRDSGPGIGRDARIAYSSLLGRYMARAYLTDKQKVRVLVPLDEAKRALEGSPYSIRKDPPCKALEADWIGLDDRRLIIAEAKGSFNKIVGAWEGPHSIPDVLQTAIGQAGRTAVFRLGRRTPLPAKRWAIASRWRNENNGCKPTLLAWESNDEALEDETLEDETLEDEDYRELLARFCRVDLDAVLEGLGHREAVDTVNMPEGITRPSSVLELQVGNQPIEPGFAAAFGPIGVYALRGAHDVKQLRDLRTRTPDIAIASLSSQYVRTIVNDPSRVDWAENDGWADAGVDEKRFASRDGLTVAWPTREEDIGESGTQD